MFFILLFSFRGTRVLFRFLQLDGNAPEEFPPRISFTSPKAPIAWRLPSFTTNKQDRLTIPVPCEVEGNSSWNPERKFRAELEKSITEICRDEILAAKGGHGTVSYFIHMKHWERIKT